MHSSRLRKAKWKLTLPLTEARDNDEVISLSESQMMRWIDELNGNIDSDFLAKTIKKDIRTLKKQPNSLQNRREIKRLYSELDKTLSRPDYLCLIIDRDKDLRRACQGFSVNGIRYTRLVGTNGGVKNETIVFVNEELAPVLRQRIDNGRNPEVKMVPGKFESYRSLTCSASVPVSMPNGILVVNDCETEFIEDILCIGDEGLTEPKAEYRKGEKVVLTESDGYGMMLPSLAKRWSEEIGLNYVMGGANTRCSFEKGMVYCFDFVDFANNVAHNNMVKDAWGNMVDITQVELVLTTSMLKLWMCYDSLEHYLRCCQENHYTFSLTKVCPKELENERNLNYQFIQSYRLNDEQIEELIKPTVDDIKDALSDNYHKAVLFLKGMYMNEYNVAGMKDDFSKAMMIDSRVFDDPYVKRKIYQMIRKRINDAKVGVIKVHGNYSIVCGDPFSLCQSMFGMTVTGLLKRGEVYNKYWDDAGTENVACFRAPMSCHENIRRMKIARGEAMSYWYRYMNTCTLFNSWDATAHALNGMDKDGDLVLLTDNRVLVENIRELPVIMCAQKTATKVVITEEELIQSNINGFGDDIGKTTNWITSMFEVQSQFEPDSPEYQMLDYRIRCGQHYQQNCIDKIKGIISNPMPKYWYDRAANKLSDDPTEEEVAVREFNLSIVADKKPYFMRYIYPNVMTQYDTYITNANKKCIREFRVTVEELLRKPQDELTEAESEFIVYYKHRMPVGTHECVMNKICTRFEEEFDGYFVKNPPDADYDYSIMKSEEEYSDAQRAAVYNLYEQYTKKLRDCVQVCKNERVDEEEFAGRKLIMVNEFSTSCHALCSNSRQLCDILLDICYNKNGTKQFCWDMCGADIIANLLDKNDHTIQYLQMDDNGEIEYGGKKFTIKNRRLSDD